MNIRASDLWRWRGTLDRGEFLFWGCLLFAIKYNLDRFLSSALFGRRWSMLDYAKAGEYLWQTVPTASNSRYFALMLAIAIPFMTAGVLLTLKRLRSMPLSPWLVLLFFVPVIKIIFFILLCLLPSRERAAPARG